MATHPHPEWRRLKEEIAPLLAVGRLFTYGELSALAGVDTTSNRGRKQLLKACDYILRECSMALENERGVGMRVIEAREHAGASKKRVLRSKRQLKKAHNLLTFADIDALTADQRRHHTAMQAAIGAVLHNVTTLNRKVAQIAEKIRANELPDAKQLKALEEMNRTWTKQ